MENELDDLDLLRTERETDTDIESGEATMDIIREELADAQQLDELFQPVLQTIETESRLQEGMIGSYGDWTRPRRTI